MNTTPIGNHLRVALKHSALALAVAAGLVAGSAQAVTTTATYNLGTQVSPKTIESGIGGLLPWIAKGVLPTGSILKSVSIDAIIENVGNDGKTDDWVQDICVYIDPSPQAAGNAALLQVGGYGTMGTVTKTIGWGNGDGGPRRPVTGTKTAADWSSLGDIDLSTVQLSVGNTNVKRSSTSGGPYTVIGTTAGTTSYTDSTATHGTTYYYVVSANNTAGESSDSNQTSARPNSAYGAWAANPAQGLTAGVNAGPMDDPDRDGIANLLEFMLGGAPMAPSQTILPKLTRTGGSWFYEYDRSDLSQPPATIQEVEYGNNLTGWASVTIPLTGVGPVVTITPASPADHVKVAIPNPGTNGFARLKVTQSN